MIKKENSTIQMTEKTQTDQLPDPAPLGLIGLAIATLVLGLTDLGLASSTDKSLMVPWAVFLGATAQLIAGIVDFKRKNTFGAAAFTLYAMLWYSVALTFYIQVFTSVTFDLTHYAAGLIGYLILSLILTIASLMTNKVLVIILVLIDLAIGALILNILTGLSSVFVGAFLIALSAMSFYGAAGVLLNSMSNKTILPLGKPIWKVSKS